MDFERIDKWLDEKLPEMETDLAALVSFPSVEGMDMTENIPEDFEIEKDPEAPYGQAVAGALETMISIAAQHGFSTTNAVNYGYADMGDAEEKDFYAVLGHLDVVPVTSQIWDTPPFKLTRIEDKLCGRGTMDDKGLMLAALYGAFALQEAGFSPRIPLRFIFGTNEETGMRGVKVYKKREKMPIGGFTPDADWPVVIGEKGICPFAAESSWGKAGDCGRTPVLISLDAGTATNIVPANASAVFEIPGESLGGKMMGDINLGEIFPVADGIEVKAEGSRIYILASGKSAHGSTPEIADNALTKLIRYLDGKEFAPVGAREYIAKLAQITADDKFGESYGLAGCDDVSTTTVSPNVCHINDEGGVLVSDMRYMVSDKPGKYDRLIPELGNKWGLTFRVLGNTAPLYVKADTPMIQGLMSAYREVSGDMREPLVIGGGTYAKSFPGMVAFGGEPADSEGRAHQANEYITEKELLTCAKIYARGIYNICK